MYINFVVRLHAINWINSFSTLGTANSLEERSSYIHIYATPNNSSVSDASSFKIVLKNGTNSTNPPFSSIRLSLANDYKDT